MDNDEGISDESDDGSNDNKVYYDHFLNLTYKRVFLMV